MSNVGSPAGSSNKRSTPTYFFLRGLAIILPPVLTIVILLWVANAFNDYIIYPINSAVRFAVAQADNNIRLKNTLEPPPAGYPPLPDWGHRYRVTKELIETAATRTTSDEAREQPTAEPPRPRRPSIPTVEQLQDAYARDVFVPMGKGKDPAQYVPLADYDFVFKQLRPQPPPLTAIGLYMEIVAVNAFRTAWQLSALALSITIVALYFLGRFVSARIGAWFVHKIEFVLARVPLVRNVYSTVKQITDFVLSDREVEFQRVVALEYPRSGSWTLGFVTGEGMLECAAAVGEPMVTVLVPTSPMPAGGFTIMVPRSQVIDLDLTVDQAVQFVVSCGVLTPPNQRITPERLEQQIRARALEPQLIGSSPAEPPRDVENGQ